VLVPLLIIWIPGLKSIPALFRWRMRLRINRWYRLLLLVEHDAICDAALTSVENGEQPDII
jgi:hypothetical protein